MRNVELVGIALAFGWIASVVPKQPSIIIVLLFLGVAIIAHFKSEED